MFFKVVFKKTKQNNFLSLVTLYFHVLLAHLCDTLAEKRMKFLISLGTAVICKILHCLCSYSTKELFISQFP